MTVLIVYQSVEGQTRTIAEFARDKAQALGRSVVMVDAADKRAEVPFEDAEAVILAAPVHERAHPPKFELLLSTSGPELKARRTLMLSVSLSAAFPEGMEEAQDYLDEMKLRTGFTPDREALVAGAVKTGRYDYFATQVVRFVVLRNRGYDPDAGEREFTDWSELDRILSDFIAGEDAGEAGAAARG